MIYTPRSTISTASLLASWLLVAASLPAAARTVDLTTSTWQFTKGDPDNAAALAFDDLAWSPVRVPHDWAIAGPFDPKEDGYAAKLPWRGVGWYRKWFTLEAAEEGSRVYLDFDGVMAFPQVYVNGQLAGEWDYGYTSFRIDATPHVRFGRANVVAVRVDTRRHGTRWYPGAGIYRKVEMHVKPPVHLAQWGTFVTTPEVTNGTARVAISNAVENHLDDDKPIVVEVSIKNPAGEIVAQASRDATANAAADSTVEHAFTINNPQRWDVDSPHLYTATTSLRIGERVVDRRDTPFGIREFEFTADDGFHLNGRRVQLKGVNLHHDHGPLGAAFNRRAMQRQLQIMQDMGVNAVRTSHNPPAAELLDLCDQMGILVWNELFDKWNETADRVDGNPPFDAHVRRHIRSLAMRDRNHPSVIAWSIGNEIPNQPHDKEGTSRQRVRLMRDLFREFDPTRPVGIGCHIPETADSDILADLDLTGWNYAARYRRMRRAYPDKPLVYTESASALSTRGHYEAKRPLSKIDYSSAKQVDSYDFNAAPWADIADLEFDLMQQDKFVAGEFVWTGFDYLGEPTPFSRDAHSSYFGIVDLCGIPKDRFYLYRSHWRPDETTVHLLPHWTWPGRDGKATPVFVYTNGDSAELFLNGKSQGVRRKGDVPPQPANLAQLAVAASSTSAEGYPVEAALQANAAGWRAASDDERPWWHVDLGEELPIRCLALEFDHEAHRYAFAVEASSDGKVWRSIASQPGRREPRWSGVNRAIVPVDAGSARYLRVVFSETGDRLRPCLRSFAAYDRVVESPYYEPTYRYRLRWDEVRYEPGELRVVASKGGQPIGEATVRTAGPPASIRLSPDRVELNSHGDDLCYLLVEALDEHGVLCPNAADAISFSINGPASVAGVGNGNPLSLEPYQASQRKLFHGKAMLIVRADGGPGGEIRIRASADGLPEAEAVVEARRPE